jgi:hypothetical protein
MNDRIRQTANLILAPMMWILSTLPQVTDWGRTASEFSDQNDSLLVPFGLAFSIWFPIFVLCIAYAVIQALPSKSDNAVFRAAGPWTAFGFLGVSLWALISAHAPDSLVLWGTALVFVFTVFCLVKALFILRDRRQDLNGAASIFSNVGIGMIAGWTSLAMFLNWTPLIGRITGLGEVLVCAVMLVIALVLIATVLKRSGGYVAYAFPAIWGLSFLSYERYKTDVAFETLGVMAAIGALGLIIFTVILNRRRA